MISPQQLGKNPQLISLLKAGGIVTFPCDCFIGCVYRVSNEYRPDGTVRKHYDLPTLFVGRGEAVHRRGSLTTANLTEAMADLAGVHADHETEVPHHVG